MGKTLAFARKPGRDLYEGKQPQVLACVDARQAPADTLDTKKSYLKGVHSQKACGRSDAAKR